MTRSIQSEPENRKEAAVLVGAPPFQFEVETDWIKRPTGFTWQEVAGVACDSRDRLFVFSRGPHPMMVFDDRGEFLQSWGEGIFARAHGLTIGPDDSIYCTDDLDHTVRKFTPEGRLLLTLGTSGQPSATGATSVDFRTIRQAGPPFHFPTNLALGRNGEIYVADGYGNARIHEFTPEGELIRSWGEPGSGPGQFHIPHGIAVAAGGEIFVADRENSRIQIFTSDGRYLDELTDVVRPCQVIFDPDGNLLVAELGFRSGIWPGTSAPSPDAPGGRVSVFNSLHVLQARWGGGEQPTAPGDFYAPHDLCLNSRGDLFVAEVMWSAGGNRGLVSPDCHSLQTFKRR
jgi:DNA-binding beta-propeller fold protein YncE